MREQRWDPGRYARNAGFVTELAGPVLELLGAEPGERILDLGCGHGVLTRYLQDWGADVLGVDKSEEQVLAARHIGVRAEVVAAEDIAFEQEFDAVFSNAVLHWVKDQDKTVRAAFRALKPGGRFVGELGGEGNVKRVVAALSAALARRGVDALDHNPWTFPSADDFRARLEDAGFEVEGIIVLPRPTLLPGDVVDWLETFGESFTQALPPGQRMDYLDEVRAQLSPFLRDDQDHWMLDYVRLRFIARRPRHGS